MGLYAIVRDGKVIDAPVRLTKRVDDIGGFHRLTDEQRKASGWYPAVVIGQIYNPRTHHQNPPVCTFSDETQTVTVEYPLIAKSLAQVKREMLEELAAHRFAIETGGITVGGAPIKTDRESQGLISGAHASMAAGFIESVRWKRADGLFVTITAEQFGAIAQAVAVHVQSCFSAESTVAGQIESAPSVAHLLTIDIKAAFEAARQ